MTTTHTCPTNDQMTEGRFLRLHRGRTKLRTITGHLSAGGRVRLVTYTRATEYGPKHATWFTIDRVGSVYVNSGRRRVCIDFTPVQYSRQA